MTKTELPSGTRTATTVPDLNLLAGMGPLLYKSCSSEDDEEREGEGDRDEPSRKENWS